MIKHLLAGVRLCLSPGVLNLGEESPVTITVPEKIFKKMTSNGTVLYLNCADGYINLHGLKLHTNLQRWRDLLSAVGFTNINLCERRCHQVTEEGGRPEVRCFLSTPAGWGGEGDQDGCCHISATGSVLGGSVLKREIKVTTGQSVPGTHPR